MIFVIFYQCQWTNAKDSAWQWAFNSKRVKIPQRQQEDKRKTTQIQHEDNMKTTVKTRGRQHKDNTKTAQRQQKDKKRKRIGRPEEDNTSCYLGRIAAPATSPSFTNCSVFLATCANEHRSCNQSTISETSKTMVNTVEQLTMW